MMKIATSELPLPLLVLEVFQSLYKDMFVHTKMCVYKDVKRRPPNGNSWGCSGVAGSIKGFSKQPCTGAGGDHGGPG